MSISRLWQRMAVVALACGTVALVVPAMGASLFVSPASTSCAAAFCTSDSPWAGWGLHGKVGSVTLVVGTWVQPTIFTCPTQTASGGPAHFSEAIGVGLNFLSGGRMDGVGTLGFCITGVAFYAAWFDEAPAPAVLIPIPVVTPAPGNLFNATVSCASGTCHYFLEDQTTLQTFSLVWSYLALPLNFAECVVMEGTTLGVLPATFAPIPPSAHAVGNVQFGSLFTGHQGCMGGTPAALVGFGAAPAPTYTPVRFTMSVVPLIAPTPLVPPLLTGLAAQDSFTVA